MEQIRGWFGPLALLFVLGGLVYMFIQSRRQAKTPTPERRPFVPDLETDKSIVVAGWSEDELQRILRDFAKMYELSPEFDVKALPETEATFSISFPGDMAPDHFFFLVNYLNYPIDVDLTDRVIGVLGKATLTTQFDVPDPSLIGRRILVNVPAEDRDYDVVDVRVESGPAFRWPFSDNLWHRLQHAVVPEAVRNLCFGTAPDRSHESK